MKLLRLRNRIALPMGLALFTAIFIADLLTPLGIAMGMMYIGAVLLTIFTEKQNHTFYATVLGIVLTISGLIFSPNGEIVTIYVTNRVLSLVGIVFAGIIVSRYKKYAYVVEKQKHKLQVMTENLKASNKELENFAYISSHDLQEPLRKIRTFGDRIQTLEGDKLSEKGKDYLDRMLNAAERMQHLINDLLSFSRLKTRENKHEAVNLNDVLHDVMSDLEVLIHETDAEIKLNFLPVIQADRQQMYQLFQNLISNSLKYRSEERRPFIQIYAQQAMNKRGMIEIIVEDNGKGFDEKYLDKIFTIFQRLDNQKERGSGIGLAICRKIARFHGGEITARSRINEGSAFIVNLAMPADMPKEHKSKEPALAHL